MPDPNYCDITLLIDRSGSMEKIRGGAEEAINGFVHEQRLVPGKCLVTLVQFDNDYEVVHAAVPVAELPFYALVPRGATAYFDALGRAIVSAAERLGALAERDRPSRIVFVVVTDGEENASVEYTDLAKLRAMVARHQDRFGWDFVFLGANLDAARAARHLAIPAANAMNYAHTDAGVKSALRCAARGVTANRRSASAGMPKVAYLADPGPTPGPQS
jgi:hypothetical protein